MRWIWMDRFLEFESGVRAKAIKNISLAEDHLHDHFPGFPVMPASLIIEGLAQTGGILVGEANDFSQRVVLGKIPKAEFFDIACAGDQLIYDVELVDLSETVAIATGTATADGRLVAKVELFFVHLDQAHTPHMAVDKNFVFTDEMLSMLRLVRAESHATQVADAPSG
jgi:3-hydroxyacyl-[acyl-carrier-protein] dehydratase